MSIPCSLLIFHWIADFLAQTDEMAIQKSKSLKWLTLHVLTYTGIMGLWALIVLWSPWMALLFMAATFLTHWLTDFATSKISRELFPWKQLPGRTLFTRPVYLDYEGMNFRSRHWFFVMIGLDQLIHYFTLGLTYSYLAQ